jgi:DNA segregation ATPase FtsK/SpoIIIE-like protein
LQTPSATFLPTHHPRLAAHRRFIAQLRALRHLKHHQAHQHRSNQLAAGHAADRQKRPTFLTTPKNFLIFISDETLAVKSVKLLDVLTEKDRGTSRNDDERFDGDFMLMTGELAKLLADLGEALGGAAEGDAPVTRPTADTAPAKGVEPVREQRAVTGHNLGAVPEGDGSASDPLYENAVTVVRTNQRASIALVQRHLKIGHNRAARLLQAMEGSVDGPMQSNGDRELLKQGNKVFPGSD